ncbi:MAG: DUF3990 domain-containing protein [Eubacterium sp.]|nr:DUF3990 domain-containing protein [Eubacterium sp.]
MLYKKYDQIEICHGSKDIVERPVYGKGEINNDYGRGFYSVSIKNEELAKEWACSPFNSTGVGFVNRYSLDTRDLNVLDFEKRDIIYWIVLTATCREPNLKGNELSILQKEYLIDTALFDCIYGWRCDDTYSRIIARFMDDACTDKAIWEATRLGHLNRQFVIVSEKAFDHLKYNDSYKVNDFSRYRNRFLSRKNEADDGFNACVRKNRSNGKYLTDYLEELK